eukprot:2423182-Rhodomonas_salina.1
MPLQESRVKLVKTMTPTWMTACGTVCRIASRAVSSSCRHSNQYFSPSMVPLSALMCTCCPPSQFSEYSIKNIGSETELFNDKGPWPFELLREVLEAASARLGGGRTKADASSMHPASNSRMHCGRNKAMLPEFL